MKANGIELDKVQVIIPAYNEETTIGKVIERLQALGLQNIRVVNNASDDNTAAVAEKAGAEVMCEPVKGYGQACWTGYQTLSPDCEWVLFCDADGSDDLESLPDFFAVTDRFDFILANRRVSKSGRRAMTPIQNFGNAFAAALIHLVGDLDIMISAPCDSYDGSHLSPSTCVTVTLVGLLKCRYAQLNTNCELWKFR